MERSTEMTLEISRWKDRVNNKESFLGGVVAGPAAGNQKVTGLTRRCDCRHRQPVCIEVFIDVA
jgi:hypothetical protein